MKAEIINGQLVLFPANETEQFAVLKWRADFVVFIQDDKRNETQFIRGSAIKVAKPTTTTYVPPG